MPKDDAHSLYYSAFAESDSLAILCSNDGFIQAVTDALIQQLPLDVDNLVGQQLLVGKGENEPSLEWLSSAPYHQKEWLVQGQISVSEQFSCLKKLSSFYVKKLFNAGTLVGYHIRFALESSLQTTLPQRAWLQLFDDSPDGVILFNESMQVIATNNAFNRLSKLNSRLNNRLLVDDLLEVEGSFSKWLTHAKSLTTPGVLINTDTKTDVTISVTPFDIGNQMYFWCFISDLSNTTKLQQKLNATLLHFKTLFDNNRDGIALTDLENNFIEVNQQFAKILGYEREHLIGRHFSYFNAEDSFELSNEQMQNFIETGFTEPFEKQLVRVDNSTLNVSVQLFPHYTEDDQYSGSWCIVHPISNQTQHLRRQKKRFEMLLERSIDAIAYSNFKGEIEVANPAFCDMVGRSAEELIGTNYKEFTSQEDIQREETLYKDQLLERGYSDVYVKNFILPDGDTVAVSIRTVLIRSDDGTPEGVWSISRDNKLRDRLVESLADSEYRFRSLFSNSFDAIALWTPNDEIKYANKAYLDLVDYSHEELRSFNFRDFTPPGWEDIDALMIQQIEQRGYSDIVEKEIIRRNGERVPISIRASGMKDASGELIGSWVIIRDISDYRNTLKKLEHSQNLLRQTSRMSRVGGWEFNIDKQEFIFTEETYRILSIPGSYSLTVKSVSKVLDPQYEAMVFQAISTTFKTDTHQEVELKLSGFEPERWIRVSAQAGYETGNSKKYLYGAVQDISDFKQKEKSLESDKFIYQQLAFHDPLTQLPNRLLLADRFHQTTSQAKRDNKIVALIVIDLDNFKQINDEFGHPAGDALLKVLSSRFISNVRTNDTVSRLGGDEFVIIARLDSQSDINAFAQKILKSLGEPIKWQEQTFVTSASMGVALYPHHGSDFDSLYTRADKALYWRKNNRKNGFTIAD